MVKLRAGIVCLILILTSIACQSAPSTPVPVATTVPSPVPTVVPATPAPPTQLNLAISSEPPILDPQRTSDGAAAEVFGRACETLVYQDFDLTAQPLLAESWTFAADGKAITLTLRQGITFHDGTPFNAEAVKFTFERLQKPESEESPIYGDFQGITITAPAEYTVVFRFPEPRFNFLETLRNAYAVILSPTALQTNEEQFGRKPICTGPYQVQEWAATQYVLLVRNPNYAWAPAYYTNRGPAKIDQVRINFVTENDTRYLALLNGELDMLSLSTPEQVAEIQGKADQFTIYEGWVGGISFLGFNYKRPPTNEPLVRQALSHAVDKQAIVDMILPGMAAPAFAPLAPTIFGYDPSLANFEYKYDQEKSKQLLAQAGFVDGNGDGILERDGRPLHLVLLTTDSSTYGKIFTVLQSEFKAVGVDIELRAVPTSELAKLTAAGDFGLLLYHYNWPFPDALEKFLGTERISTTNRVGYSNPVVDDLLTQAAQQPPDSPEKRALLVQAQQIILQDAPWQPLLVRKVVTAANNRVYGIKVHPSGGLLLHDAEIVQP